VCASEIVSSLHSMVVWVSILSYREHKNVSTGLEM
jgi:hypothetical protein